MKENGGWTKKRKIETESEVFHISEKSKMKLSGVSFFLRTRAKTLSQITTTTTSVI